MEEENLNGKKKPKKQIQPYSEVIDDAFAACTEVYLFTPNQIQVLKEFQKDCDLDAALKRAGLSAKYKQPLTDPTSKLGQAFLKELNEIQSDFLNSIKLNAQKAAAKHMEVFETIEEDYKSIDTEHKNKPGMAGALARMSDSTLRATGQYHQEQKNSGVKVEINIDLGDKPQEAIDVTHEVVDD